MKKLTRSVTMGVLSALLLTAISLTKTYAESPSRIWGGADVYIGYGSMFDPGTGKLTCNLYNSNGKLLDKKEDGVSGTATFDLSKFPNTVHGEFNLSGTGRDLAVDMPATEEVQAGVPDGILQASTGGSYIVLAGEHKTSDGSTLIHRCKVQVLDDGGYFCRYCIFMIVKNIV